MKKICLGIKHLGFNAILAILICLSYLSIAQAKTEDTTSIMAPVSTYGTNGSDVVPVKVGSDGTVAVNGVVTATVSGVSTAAAQTDGSQKTKIVDGSGNVIGATSNALDINIKSGNITGFATAAKQPALGTAGSSSTDVISVQGIASGTALPVSVASVPSHAVTNAGTFAVQNTSNIESATLIHKTIDFSASETAQIIWTPTSGKKFVITDIIISCSAAGAITVFDNTDSTTNRVVKGNFAANGGLTHPYSKAFISVAADNVLKYTTGAGIAGSITVSGYEI